MPKGGFGNLIALPLQKTPRTAGNSVFVDGGFVPYPDQWAYLSGVPRMSRAAAEAIVAKVITPEQALGLAKLPAEAVADETEPWRRLPSGRTVEPVYSGPKPEQVAITLGNLVYVATDGLPPPLRNELVRLAAFPNPEFFQAQALRLPIFNLPRVICCHELLPHHVGLPRGVLQAALDLFQRWGIAADVRDERFSGTRIKVKFKGELRPMQKDAFDALLAHDTGVLAASTAFGKTVLAAKVIAARKVRTLIMVHSRQLLDQWLERLSTFLEIAPKSIGQIRGGKDKPTGIIDVATIQSLVRKGVVDDRVADYGQVIVDECHHISAQSFELVARQCKARHLLGLSATVKRKDGHHPIIFMQCGPVRFEITDQAAAEARPFAHFMIPHFTEFRMPPGEGEKPPVYPVHQVFLTVQQDAARNAMIATDVRQSLREGRNPLVLTERIEHLETLAQLLTAQGEQVFVLRGGMGVKEKRKLMEEYNAVQAGAPRVLLSTGRFLGEGFDDARLDTLFLAFPVSWRGTLAQYAGRLHRLCDGKKQVVIHDYADTKDAVLAAMYRRRCAGYHAIGYEVLDGRTIPMELS
jgi:superfamily II DNA or RNA helicase